MIDNKKIETYLRNLFYIADKSFSEKKKTRALPLHVADGIWQGYIFTDPPNGYKLSLKFYGFSPSTAPKQDLGIVFTQFGKLSGNWMEYIVNLNTATSTAFIGKAFEPITSLETDSIKVINPIQDVSKPKNEHGCECGAFAIGAKKGDPAHSDWCPCKGVGKTKKTAKSIKI